LLYGIEKLSFTLIFTWTLEKNKNSWRSIMEQTIVTLTLTTVVSFLALLVGGMIGWMARQHSYETTPQVVYTHPEMFDENGQLVPDEILALRIENNYDFNTEETTEEE
jgi:ABC-type spermidine/putrescine transport system permease subunit II